MDFMVEREITIVKCNFYQCVEGEVWKHCNALDNFLNCKFVTLFNGVWLHTTHSVKACEKVRFSPSLERSCTILAFSMHTLNAAFLKDRGGVIVFGWRRLLHGCNASSKCVLCFSWFLSLSEALTWIRQIDSSIATWNGRRVHCLPLLPFLSLLICHNNRAHVYMSYWVDRTSRQVSWTCVGFLTLIW